MADHALNSDAVSVQRGQLRLTTECGRCGKRFTNPSRGAKHALTHAKPAVLGGQTPPSYRVVVTAIPAVVLGGAGHAERFSPEKERQRLVSLYWPHRVQPTICAWCGRNVTKEKASIHHLTPREAGGTDEIRNLTPVHVGACHDYLEMWQQDSGRPPNGEEWGHLDRLWGNVSTPGVGTRKQEVVVPRPVADLSVDDVPKYLAYLKKIDQQYREQIATNPSWGMWAQVTNE